MSIRKVVKNWKLGRIDQKIYRLNKMIKKAVSNPRRYSLVKLIDRKYNLITREACLIKSLS